MEPEAKFEGEGCMSESWQDLARGDAERLRRGDFFKADGRGILTDLIQHEFSLIGMN